MTLQAGRRRPALFLAFAMALALPAAARAQEQPPLTLAQNPSLPERARISQIVVRYLSTWNERDATRRRELIAKVWAENGSYVDPNRAGRGYEQIDALVARAHQAYPAPYALRLVSTIEIHHDYVRFSWAAGGQTDAPLYLAGTDMMRLTADGRVESVVGFADAPAVAPPPPRS